MTGFTRSAVSIASHGL